MAIKNIASSDLLDHVKDGVLRVHAKPGKKKTRIIGFDDSKNALVVEVGARAEDNKANVELVKFLSKGLKRPVVLKSGFTGKDKLLILG
ncbi:DUF167 domain-containing protein [Candidatus Woesearchaeota archaeon]|nr:DUF167 domain-containing protein [Candidatus Woesearchaeota archaeon]